MFIVRIWNYFCGYAIIIVKGLKIERFINLSVVNGIYLWDIEKIDYASIKAKISIKDFHKLRKIVKKTDSKVEIKEKCGIPFRIKVVKRRKWFFLGLGMLLIFLYILSSHIWMIEIAGLESIPDQLVLENLNEYGLRIGVRKSKIDKRKLETRMLIEMPEFTWVGMEVKGTKATITLIEKGPTPEVIRKDEPCHIIAGKNGLIHRILVLSGDGTVDDGETVEKGQVLVTGIIERPSMDLRYVHSMAKVLARTYYEDTEEVGFKQIKFEKTGKQKKIYGIEIVRKRLERDIKIPYEDYNKNVEERYLLSFGNYVFPIKLIINRYEELKPIENFISEKEAKSRCAERLMGKIKLQLPEDAEILDKRIEYFVNKESVMAKIYVEALEDIGVKERIDEWYIDIE